MKSNCPLRSARKVLTCTKRSAVHVSRNALSSSLANAAPGPFGQSGSPERASAASEIFDVRAALPGEKSDMKDMVEAIVKIKKDQEEFVHVQ